MKLKNVIRAHVVRTLPLGEWPNCDRQAWMAACEPAHRLRRGGSAGHLAAASQADLARRYGYYLDHLDRKGTLYLASEAAAVVTPDGVQGFISELKSRVSSVTVSQSIRKLRRAAECIDPSRDFSWLREVGNDLELFAQPRDKFQRLVMTERLVEAGLSLFTMAESSTQLTPLRRAIMARNGLMVALLALCPIRLGNFASLEIGATFDRIGREWWIRLPKTKSGRPDHRPVPEIVRPLVDRYVESYRPQLISGSTNSDVSALWISRYGKRLSQETIPGTIISTTKRQLGTPVNPHSFRDSAAITAALHSPQIPHLASALLQHADPMVTERHYNRANSVTVARDFTNLIRQLGKF